MWWKLYFGITIVELLLQLLGLFVNPGVNLAIQIAMFLIFAMAVIGMYSFTFRKKLFNPLFWQYFTWIYVLLDLLYLLYAAAPNAPVISALAFIQVYTNQNFVDVFVGVAIDIPLIYAMYRLTKEEPFLKEEKKVKDEPYRWGMIQIALWGYSLILMLYLFIFAFFPQGDAAVQKDQATDPLYIAGMFAPLLIFWLWVVVAYKKYKWNWWRTTLAANGLLYSGMILWSALFPTNDQVTQQSLAGIDIISLLQVFIMLLGLWVFGKMQFGKTK